MQYEERITLRLPAELVARLEARAGAMDRSVAWLVRQAVVKYLEGDKG